MFIDNSAGPREFGPNDDASLELPAEGAYRVQEALRVMGWDPHHPRVFSQAKGLVPVWLPLTAEITWGMLSIFLSNSDGIRDSIGGWFCFIFFLGTPVWILSDVTLRRYGVDYDKIWTRFGHLFYHQIRFTDITRFDIGGHRYKSGPEKPKSTSTTTDTTTPSYICDSPKNSTTATSNSPKPTSPTPTGTKKPKYGATSWQPMPIENTATSTTPTPNN
ncbi:hypothetical protein HMPREF9588_00075 [Cutibacterium acnes HL025PA2]|nr:hypothetical protein HMPREF9588_00075 [Cutibacterium acnes HL025PA2]